MEGEIDKNHNDIDVQDEVQRTLIEIRSELNRKLTALSRDKEHQLEALKDLSVNIEGERKVLIERETRRLNL
jgi:hypothetical protein